MPYTFTITGALTGAAINVFNGTGISLNPGTLVYIDGYDYSSDNPSIDMADATNAYAPAMLVVTELIAGASVGQAASPILIFRYDTSQQAVGDICYLSETVPGSIQWTIPTESQSSVQAVGVVKTIGNPGEIYFYPSLSPPAVLGKTAYQGNAITGGAVAVRGINSDSELLTGGNIAEKTLIAANAGVGIPQVASGTSSYLYTSSTICTVPANSFVTGCWAICTETWTGNPIINIGDGDNSSGYLANANINTSINQLSGVNASTRGVYLWDSVNYAQIIKFYDTDTNIVASVTNPDVIGSLTVYVSYVMV